jgi:amino acid transporter
MSAIQGSLSRSSLSKERLGVPSVVFFVMSAAAPLTVIAGVVTTAYATIQVTGIPLGFITIAVILAFFSVGYVAMSRHIANAGAFYTYVTHGLGRPMGVGAAWMALLAYNALQMGLYGIVGAATQPVLDKFFGVSMEWWVIALAMWAIVAILGVLRVDVNGGVLAFLLCAEIIIVLIYDFAYLTKPAEGGVTFDTLLPSNLFGTGLLAVGAVLVITFLGFTGFESSVVFSEESKNPRRTVALATYTALIIIGGTYALSSWAMSVATGPANIIEVSGQSGPETIFALAGERLPEVFVDIGLVLFATSVLAAAISFHNTVARYTFALGRERVFPSQLSATARRSGAPIAGSLVQSLLGLVVIVLYVVFDLDPVVQLFFWVGTGGGFGIMLLVTVTSLAVILFFLRNSHGENLWRRFIAPVLALVAMAAVSFFAIKDFNALLGVAPDDPLRWIVPLAYPAVGLLGIIWALILKVSKPDVYARIGLGANTATGISTQSRVVSGDQYQAQHGVGAGQRDIYQ